MEDDQEREATIGSSSGQTKKLTLEKAIELGEYDPKFLSNFPEWHDLSKHVQFQFIRRALDNRNRQLITQYAELSNVLDFSKKPELKDAMRNVEKQIRELREDKERLYTQYS
jgi:hypothetical protein